MLHIYILGKYISLSEILKSYVEVSGRIRQISEDLKKCVENIVM
jgi:hypothetical protein